MTLAQVETPSFRFVFNSADEGVGHFFDQKYNEGSLNILFDWTQSLSLSKFHSQKLFS
jgi:hypothetical protein